MTDARLQVGFSDVVRFGVGVAVPSLILISATIIALFVLAGGDSSSGITVAFTAAFVAAIALEMFRRVVLVRRSAGAIGLFRMLVWSVVAAALPVTILLGAGVFLPCYGRSCDGTAKFMLEFMFACCVLTLPMVLFGRGLLGRAEWLRVVG